MKNIIGIFLCLVILTPSILAQIDNSIAMKDEFSTISKLISKNTLNTGFEGLQTYSNGVIKGSQFFSPNWTKGSVTTKDGFSVSKNYLFLYDKVRQELFIKETDSKEILLADKSEIGTFALNTDKVHHFIPALFYDHNDDRNFYEILEKCDTAITLLKKINTRFVADDKRNIQKVKNGDFGDEFKDEIKYYLSYKKGTPEEVKLKSKSILKVVPEQKRLVSTQYLNQVSGKIDEQYLTDLIHSINK